MDLNGISKYLNGLMMKQTVVIIFFGTLAALITSCTSNTESTQGRGSSNSYPRSTNAENENNENGSYQNSESNQQEAISENDSGCKFEDGTYTATVDYNNDETGYAATYTLDVEVQDCQVVQINFPNDGYLDGDHISYADLNEDGSASIDGEDGKTYEIKIDQ